MSEFVIAMQRRIDSAVAILVELMEANTTGTVQLACMQALKHLQDQRSHMALVNSKAALTPLDNLIEFMQDPGATPLLAFRVRLGEVLSKSCTDNCSCGGAGPDEGCGVCNVFHDVRKALL